MNTSKETSLRVILGAGLIHAPLLKTWLPLVEEQDFEGDGRAKLYFKSAKACEKNGSLDRPALTDEMRRRNTNGLFKEISLDAYLEDLADDVVTIDPAAVIFHAKRFRAESRKERRARRLNELAHRALNDEEGESLGAIERLLEEERRGAATEKRAPARAKEAALSDWSTALPAPMRTGLQSLDAAIGGVRPESTYSIIGSSGKGKSGFTIQLTRGLLRFRPVLYVSTELSRRQALARFAAQELGESWSKVYALAPEGAPHIAQVLETHCQRLRVLKLERNTSLTDELDRAAQEEGEAPVLVLDYLQHAARRLEGDDPRVITAQMSDEITSYVTANRTSALVVSSTARGFYKDNDKRAATDFLGAAKNSGDVEFDASAVLFLDTDPCPLGGSSNCRLHIAKSRFGGEGQTIGLKFIGARGMFEEDPSAALDDNQRDVFEMIGSGAGTVEEVARGLQRRKQDVTDVIDLLARRGLITKRPLEVIGK